MATPGKPVSLKERMPTERDADRLKGVLAYDSHHRVWFRQHFQNLRSASAQHTTHWMTPPPAPEQ